MSQAYLDDSHHPHANPLCMTTTGYLNHLGDWPWVNTGPPVVDFVSSLPTQSSNIQSITESNAKGPNIHIWASTHECQDAIPRLVAPQATVPLNLIVGGPIKGLVADPIAHRPTLKTEPPRHDEAPYEFYCFNMDADGRRCRSGPHRGRSAIAKHWMSCSGHSRLHCEYCGTPFTRTFNYKRHLRETCPVRLPDRKMKHVDRSRRAADQGSRQATTVLTTM